MSVSPCGVRCGSGVDAVEGSGEGDGFADVVQAADPGDGTLDAHAEAGVGDGAVAAEVEVPLEGFEGEVVVEDALAEEVVGVDALGAADDFAVALGGEDVDAEGFRGVGGVGLHVEGFDGGGVAVDHDGAVVEIGDVGLVGGAEVVAVGVGVFDFSFGVGFGEDLVGFVVGDLGEGGLDCFEFGGVAADYFEVCGVVLRTVWTMWVIKFSASSMRPESSQKATSGSIIQNSVRWRRVLDFSARKVGPKL